jgi:hypothetical protein
MSSQQSSQIATDAQRSTVIQLPYRKGPLPMMMFTRAFCLAVLERSAKTIAQTAGALLIASGTGLIAADWVGVVSASGMAGLVSILTSIGTGIITDGGPSIGNVEAVAPPTPRRAMK